MLQSREFTCARCGFTFPKGRTDAEAMAEAKENFGDDIDQRPLVVICDDCYQLFMEARERRGT